MFPILNSDLESDFCHHACNNYRIYNHFLEECYLFTIYNSHSITWSCTLYHESPLRKNSTSRSRSHYATSANKTESEWWTRWIAVHNPGVTLLTRAKRDFCADAPAAGARALFSSNLVCPAHERVSFWRSCVTRSIIPSPIPSRRGWIARL